MKGPGNRELKKNAWYALQVICNMLTMINKSDNASISPAIPEPLSVLGIQVVPFESYSQAVQCIDEVITSKRKAFWVAINPRKVYQATRDRQLRSILNRADVGICDGIGVALASKLLNGRFLSRCTGCDLFFHLVSNAARKGWGIFMLGASPESNEKACLKLQEMYPGLRIVGRRDGYFQDSSTVIEEINASGADLLFVAMGSPKQEFWISQYRESIQASFCMGVGGTFDVISGKAKRAPKVFRKTGTEFLFRLVMEPRRLKRQVTFVPYMLKVFKEMLFGPSEFPNA